MKTNSKPKDRLESNADKRKPEKAPLAQPQDGSPKESSGARLSAKPPALPQKQPPKTSARKNKRTGKLAGPPASVAPARKTHADRGIQRSASETNDPTKQPPQAPKPKKRASIQPEKRPRNTKTGQKSPTRPALRPAADPGSRQAKQPVGPPAQAVQALETRLKEERRYYSELLSKKDRQIGELERKLKELQQSKSKG